MSIEITQKQQPFFNRFSPLALGFWRLASWNYSSGQLLDLISHCLDLGITTFDHADIYGDYTCELIFGDAIKSRSSLRDKMTLVSKCGIKLVSERRPQHTMKSYQTSKEHILLSVENSLRALHTDYLDVLLIHRPTPLMNADVIAEAFNILKQQGKVRHFGVSNFMPWQFDLLQSRLDFSLITNQIEISVMCTDPFLNGVLDHCQQHRYQPMAWSPLAGGRLFDHSNPYSRQLCEVLGQIGYALGGYAVDQVAIAWLKAHPARIVPVLGTGKIEKIGSLVQACNISLSTEQWLSIFIAATGKDLP